MGSRNKLDNCWYCELETLIGSSLGSNGAQCVNQLPAQIT